jgi:hypothetical protein
MSWALMLILSHLKLVFIGKISFLIIVLMHVSAYQVRGAYLEDCRTSAPTCAQGHDEDGSLRKELWKVTEEQLAAAVQKAGL